MDNDKDLKSIINNSNKKLRDIETIYFYMVIIGYTIIEAILLYILLLKKA